MLLCNEYGKAVTLAYFIKINNECITYFLLHLQYIKYKKLSNCCGSRTCNSSIYMSMHIIDGGTLQIDNKSGFILISITWCQVYAQDEKILLICMLLGILCMIHVLIIMGSFCAAWAIKEALAFMF
jgi:pyrrolidone-carboxylate peptidase